MVGCGVHFSLYREGLEAHNELGPCVVGNVNVHRPSGSGAPGDCSRVYMGMDENTIVARFRHYRLQASQPLDNFNAAFAILQEHRYRAM